MQQINLYTAEFQPRRAWLTAAHLLLGCAAILALGLLIGLAQLWHSSRLQRELGALETAVKTEQAALAAAQAQLDQRRPSPALTRELARAQAEEAAKKQLLDALEAGALTDRVGYARILVGLARHPLDGLWLEGIDIKGSEVNLTGNTRSADLVPLYIDTIVQDTDFGPRSYDSLSVKADDKGTLAFALRAHREGAVQ